MNRRLPPSYRRLVLGGALLAATVCAILPETPPARAAEPPSRVGAAQARAEAANAAAQKAAGAVQQIAEAATDVARQAAADVAKETAAEVAREAARQAAEDAKTAAKDAADAAADAGDRSHRHRGIRFSAGTGPDRQYDSFDEFLDRDPALASMVLGIVFIVFLTPILIIALIIWYKMRKNRMQSELMIKLAEKGIVPPADAIAAIGSGRTAPMLGAVAAGAPVGEQVRAMRKSAAWSDLRKGVLMGTVGLAFTLYAMFEDGSPSWFGLVLLFLGIGYVVLWYFEDRQATPAPAVTGGDTGLPPGPGSAAN